MLINSEMIDLDKAKNWMELMAAERLTVNPMRQSWGENNQLLKLGSVFPNVVKYQTGSLFLHNGKVYSKSNVPAGVRTDIDAVIEDPNNIILLTLKTTRSNKYKGGGAQSNSFDQVMDLINEAPSRKDKRNLWLGVYLSGEFWFEIRKQYKTYSIDKPITCFNLLKRLAKEKKCVVFSDDDLPKEKMTFNRRFLRNIK